MSERMDIPKVYDPQQVEERQYQRWLEGGYFQGDVSDEVRARYCITIPPPNITGSLHLGHALNHSIHDALLRWHRMRGENTLCVPGTDHAGIATQNVVDRELRKEGTSRWEMGREKFVERVWQWREQYGETILKQFRKLGCSYDWRYTRFTLDADYAGAVLDVFIQWWQDGHLYIGERVINWCPQCRTAISDIEVDTNEENAKLYHLRYPFEDGSGYVVVATTRPETMLGDVAVAVNPKDSRYEGMHGKQLRLPLVGRLIPLIADPYPDPEFGTGAVKITPAHDANDYEVGARHKLPRPVVMNEDATINTERLREELKDPNNPYLLKYHDKDRYEVRKLVLADLEEGGFLERVEDYVVPLSKCDRCKTVLEPLLSEQWFCRMKQIAEPAIRVVKEGKIRFIPDRYEEIYMQWMENIRDWCVSRQLWWGHQIPAWYCMDCHPDHFETMPDGSTRIKKRTNPVVQKDAPGECPRCRSQRLIRDPDVLDTWFSSAIWPQTVLGWPKSTDELRQFYPTNVLMTAQEILFLWVARMIMTGLYFVNDIPFRDVYIHATVLNKEGKRMSKSLGTGIDPLQMIEQYGADALRWSLLQQSGLQQSFRFYEERVVTARNFANKIWNASRFLLMNLEGVETPPALPESSKLNATNRWILSRLQGVIQAVNESLEGYRFDEGANALYEFIWNEVCDWYIEAVKPRLQDPDQQITTRAVLLYLFDQWLRLLHPFMPHITEEIWSALPHEGESLCIAEFPQAKVSLMDTAAEAEIGRVFEAIRSIRNLRAEVKITPGVSVKEIYINATEPRIEAQLRPHASLISALSWCETVVWGAPPADSKAIANALEGAQVLLPIEGVIDLDKELERLRREIGKTEEEARKLQSRLRNPQFLERANPEVVQEARDQERVLLERHAQLTDRLKHLGG